MFFNKKEFIGDAMTDYDAAVKLNVNFLGIVHKDAASPFPPDTKVAAAVELTAGGRDVDSVL